MNFDEIYFIQYQIEMKIFQITLKILTFSENLIRLLIEKNEVLKERKQYFEDN